MTAEFQGLSLCVSFSYSALKCNDQVTALPSTPENNAPKANVVRVTRGTQAINFFHMYQVITVGGPGIIGQHFQVATEYAGRAHVHS